MQDGRGNTRAVQRRSIGWNAEYERGDKVLAAAVVSRSLPFMQARRVKLNESTAERPGEVDSSMKVCGQSSMNMVERCAFETTGFGREMLGRGRTGMAQVVEGGTNRGT